MRTQRRPLAKLGLLLCCFPLIANADSPARKSDNARRQLILPPRLQLDHVIHAVDQLFLVGADFLFDGGSLVFAFSESPNGYPCVHVCLPRPGTVLDRSQTIARAGRQLVVASPHGGFRRYAVAHPGDIDHAKFIRLIHDAKVGQSDDFTFDLGLKEVLPVVRSAIIDGTEPKQWGSDAFSWYRSGNDSEIDVEPESENPFDDL